MSEEFNFERAKYYDEVNRRNAHRLHDQENELKKLLTEAATRDAKPLFACCLF